MYVSNVIDNLSKPFFLTPIFIGSDLTWNLIWFCYLLSLSEWNFGRPERRTPSWRRWKALDATPAGSIRPFEKKRWHRFENSYSGYSFNWRPLIEYRQIIIRLTFIRLKDCSNAQISNFRFGYSVKEFLQIR